MNEFLGIVPIDTNSRSLGYTRVVSNEIYLCLRSSTMYVLTYKYVLENKNSSANTSLCGRRFFIEMKKGERRAALCPFLNWAL